MSWFRKLFSNGEEKQSVPKGWYVHEAGQNPLHMLWFVVLINFDDVANNVETPRHFVAEEYGSFEEALHECIKQWNYRNKLK
jgi:hypothetical protein